MRNVLRSLLLRGRVEVGDVAVAHRHGELEPAREAADLELTVARARDLPVGQAVLGRAVADDERTRREATGTVAERARDGDRALLGAPLHDHREGRRVVVRGRAGPVAALPVQRELIGAVTLEHDRSPAEHRTRRARRRRGGRGRGARDGNVERDHRGRRKLKTNRHQRRRAKRRIRREAEGRSGQTRAPHDRDRVAQTSTHIRTIGSPGPCLKHRAKPHTDR